MISIILLLAIVSASLFPFTPFIFELTAASILLVPIEAYLLGQIISLSPLVYGCLLLFNIGCIYQLVPRSENNNRRSEYIPVIIWGLLFVVILSFCYLWPDFMSMGERLRDYALLSEVIKYPITTQEPWMAGANLNYYLYWYRLASFLSSLCHEPVWEMYHILQAFTFSLFITATYRILSRLCGMSVITSFLCALIIGFGSNIEGVIFFFRGDHNWWGPSRVVDGAINEFPVWSFLLGDLHPHYLNLPLLPLLILFSTALWSKSHSLITNFIKVAVFLLIAAPIWTYNSNAWEVPALGLFVGFLIFLGISEASKTSDRLWKGISKVDILPTLPIIFGSLILASSLIIAARSIHGGDPFRLVRHPIELTTVLEMLRHWGFPLALISLSLIILMEDVVLCLLAFIGIAASLIVEPAVTWIALLIVLNGLRVFYLGRHTTRDFPEIVIEALGFLSLSLIFLPEVFFLDDPYGDKSERMNTIFKAYAADWSLIHIFAFFLAAKAWNALKLPVVLRKIPSFVPLSILLVVFCGFFYQTQDQDRRSKDFHVKPISQGLSQLDTTYAGAGSAIQQFTELPDGITLEAQGNAYSMTSHVSTLSGKRSYLGWQNHVDLLVRLYDESKRRVKVTEEVYSSSSCDETKNLLQKENIQYVVVGPLEKEKFPAFNNSQFSCLVQKIQSGVYTIYSAS